MPTEPIIINLDTLGRLEGWGGLKLVNEMIRLFLENGPSRMDQIRTVLEDGDLDQPERGAHSLKSSAANMGAEHVRGIASKIELAASAGEAESVRELLPDLEEAFAEALTELESILQGSAE